MIKLRRYLFAGFMFLPLIYMQVGSLAHQSNLRHTQQSFFQYFAIALTASFIGNIWLGSFLVLNLLLFIYNGQVIGQEQVLNVLFGCLLFLFSRNFFKREKFSDYYRFILIVLAANIFIMFLQKLGIDPIFSGRLNGGGLIEGKFQDVNGFFGIKMANAIFMNLAAPILAAVNPILAIFLIIPIALCASSVAVVSTGLTALFYTYYLHKRAFRFILGLIPIIIVAFIFSDMKGDSRTFTSRFPVWHSAIRMTFQNPRGWNGLIGYGPDSYRNTNPNKNFLFAGDNFYNHGILYKMPSGDVAFQYYVPNKDIERLKELEKNVGNTTIKEGKFDIWDNPHSGPITMLFQYGLIGVFLLFGLIREIILRFRYTIKDKELIVITSGLLVYAITSLAHFPLEIARTAYLFPILLGAFYARTDKEKV